ncbi:MAG: AAA family ATPase, partial [Candidatus Gastranaerophilales bacterium]|nr:AAA family ATPase [Candidatus Gastranaerophilales bacterium]
MAIISSSDEGKKKVSRKNITPKEIEVDKVYENDIRPKKFSEYVGQENLKETLEITLKSAKQRNQPLDHMLFYGPPGLGKTTLASVIAEETGVSIKITSAPALERPRDIIGIIMNMKDGEILFIDEIHRLNKVAEEILYPAMEDFSIDRTIGKGETVKTL